MPINGRLGSLLDNLPCIMDKDLRKIWSIDDKDEEFECLGDLLDDCEYALLFESSQFAEKQRQLMMQFYMRFEAFYQDFDRFNECEEHPDWEAIIKIAKRILEAFAIPGGLTFKDIIIICPNDLSQELIDTSEWVRITEMAKEVLKAFNYQKSR